MKKCKSCGIQSKNKSFSGETNKYNAEHCFPCALILGYLDQVEIALSQPNVGGQVRKVKITATITKE